MTAIGHMVLANLKMTVRNRMALFWNLAFPAIFIVLFGFLFNFDETTYDIGIAGSDTSELTRQITDTMQESAGFSVTTGSREEETSALEDGDRAAVVVFSEGVDAGQVRAQVLYDESDPQQSQIALSAVRQYLDQVNLQTIDRPMPIEVSSQPVVTSDLDYMDFLVPGILAMSIMNSSLIGLASAFVTYREKGILRRIKATPFPLSSFIIARIISQLSIAVVQAVILIGLAWILFDVQINGNLFNVLVMVIIGAMAFLAIGFVISSFAKNQESADALSNAIAFPMLFLAGVFFPVDAAPIWLQPITRIMPLRYLADGLRDLMINNSSLPAEWLNILVLLVTCAVAVAVATRLFRWEASTA